jgi:nickel-dependent lactate racemase
VDKGGLIPFVKEELKKRKQNTHVYTEVELPVGEGKIKIHVPNLLPYAAPEHMETVPDARAEVRRAIQNPIGTPRLKDLAKGKKNAGIVVNDITRPYVGKEMILELAAELNEGGLKDDQIFLVVAYGSHRINTHEELLKMFGEEVVSRFRFVHHKADQDDTLTIMGKTDGGVVVEINKEFAEAELKITTGCITPHQSAGFSGGRKSIIPGIAGFKSLKAHHSFPIRPEYTCYGWLDGNPFHEEALKAAYIAGVDFIVNSVENEDQELIYCVAGELNEAFMLGVEKCRKLWTIKIPQKPDVLIITPGGYPRDFDLHQSQKAVGCAELICKEGGMIIMFAEMRDGTGKPGKVLAGSNTPQEIIDKFYKEGYNLSALSKSYMWARAMKLFHISIIGSKVSNSELKQMFFETYDNIEEAIKKAFERYGENASFMVIPYASETIPDIVNLHKS